MLRTEAEAFFYMVLNCIMQWRSAIVPQLSNCLILTASLCEDFSKDLTINCRWIQRQTAIRQRSMRTVLSPPSWH